MTSTTPFITAEDVWPLIGATSRRAFLRKRCDLEKTAGFPQPMPTCQSPLLWRADQILSWAEAQGRPIEAAPAVVTGGNVHLLREAARA